ncbi:MAG: TIGR02450 family Trp-rich protein [Rhodocyclaceae bacterium]|nr:TIGR02450 family Trp-rich protein [Rhodocyclaceae bacterium]MBP7081155.1 TIGR02450 family Trp-rich protein [Rhodocyclaceae bacterium]
MRSSNKRVVNPRKLLLSKWTAVVPQNKEKHFLVTKLVPAELPATRVEAVELEAIYSRRCFVMPWSNLTDQSQWLQGWK